MIAESIEKIIEFLESQGIKTKYEDSKAPVFNRVIEFEIEGKVYFIEWWVNQSYFKLENKFSSPNMPFKHIYINPNSPTTNHRYQLCFYDIPNQNDIGSISYSPMPFGCFKIPFNK